MTGTERYAKRMKRMMATATHAARSVSANVSRETSPRFLTHIAKTRAKPAPMSRSDARKFMKALDEYQPSPLPERFAELKAKIAAGIVTVNGEESK